MLNLNSKDLESFTNKIGRLQRLEASADNNGRFLIFCGKLSTVFKIRTGSDLDKIVVFKPVDYKFNPDGLFGGIPSRVIMNDGMCSVDLIGLGHF